MRAGLNNASNGLAFVVSDRRIRSTLLSDVFLSGDDEISRDSDRLSVEHIDNNHCANDYFIVE